MDFSELAAVVQERAQDIFDHVWLVRRKDLAVLSSSRDPLAARIEPTSDELSRFNTVLEKFVERPRSPQSPQSGSDFRLVPEDCVPDIPYSIGSRQYRDVEDSHEEDVGHCVRARRLVLKGHGPDDGGAFIFGTKTYLLIATGMSSSGVIGDPKRRGIFALRYACVVLESAAAILDKYPDVFDRIWLVRRGDSAIISSAVADPVGSPAAAAAPTPSELERISTVLDRFAKRVNPQAAAAAGKPSPPRQMVRCITEDCHPNEPFALAGRRYGTIEDSKEEDGGDSGGRGGRGGDGCGAALRRLVLMGQEPADGGAYVLGTKGHVLLATGGPSSNRLVVDPERAGFGTLRAVADLLEPPADSD